MLSADPAGCGWNTRLTRQDTCPATRIEPWEAAEPGGREVAP